MVLSLTITVIAWISVAISIAIFSYQAFLMCVACIPRRRRRGQSLQSGLMRFAVVIPAHNEESTLHVALDSCRQLDYPPDQYEVFVVADNCDDGTARVAEQHGARVMVRVNSEDRGKGYALQFAFQTVLSESFDAILVLDADCRLHPNALRVAENSFWRGEQVLQCKYQVGNREQSATTLMLAVANTLENDFFYEPKSRLGLFVLLRGTGMVFHRDILKAYPWDACSVIEDAQYSYRLIRQGVNARFLSQVPVVSDFPVTRNQLTVQRERWFGGGVQFAAQLSPTLLLEGVKRGNFVLIDAAISSWIIMRPVVLGQWGLSFVLALLAWGVHPVSPASPWPLKLSLAVLTGYLGYALVGLVTLRPTRGSLRLLMQIPFTVVNYLAMSAQTLVRGGPTEWHRTPRDSRP